MITVRQFFGALLAEITKARVISDAASANVAQKYLNHDLLKSFPIPRMNVREVEVQLNFAVAAGVESVSPFAADEIRQNLVHNLGAFVAALPDAPPFKDKFDADAPLRDRWNAGVPALRTKFNDVLSRPQITRQDANHTVLLLIENYSYDIAGGGAHQSIIGRVLHFVERKADAPEIGPAAEYIQQQVSDIFSRVLDAGSMAQGIEELLDLNVVVTAAELEKLNPNVLQKVKIVVDSSDRKWIVSEENGQKTHILARS